MYTYILFGSKRSQNMLMSSGQRARCYSAFAKKSFSVKFRAGRPIPDPVLRAEAGASGFLSAKGCTALYIQKSPPAHLPPPYIYRVMYCCFSVRHEKIHLCLKSFHYPLLSTVLPLDHQLLWSVVAMTSLSNYTSDPECCV